VITVFFFPLILAFGPAAVWAFRVGGLRRLWLLSALTLLAILLLALVLSAIYSVSSTWQVVLYFLAFVGPSILLSSGLLALASGFARTVPLQLIAALAGSMIGLALGYVAIVFVLGVW
jgi:hypothetical protein